jgi:hypothetical protein
MPNQMPHQPIHLDNRTPCPTIGRPYRLRRALIAAVLTLLSTGLLTLTGCTTGARGQLSEEERMDRVAELAARPRSEDMVARYEQMQQRIRDQLDTELGPFQWRQFREQSTSNCGFDFPVPDGQIVNLATWGFTGAIPDTDWPRAADIVTAITAEYGFNSTGLDIDTPGRHLITGTDTTLGAQYDLGTEVNTTMRVTTGCHLPAHTTP